MKTKGLRWALSAGAMLSGPWIGACAPLSYHEMFTATDGTVLHSETTGDVSTSAMKASGAHDLPCPIDKIESVTSLPDVSLAGSAVIGCGWRVVYRVINGPGTRKNGRELYYDRRIVLLSRSPVTSGGDQRAPNSGTGCANDTDCKGDRICAQGQCTEPAH